MAMMNSPQSHVAFQPGPSSAVVARFTELWRQGPAPDLGAFLAQAMPLSAEQLAEVLCVDQRERWLLGERPQAEAYVRLYARSFPNSEYVLDLLYNEFLVRRQVGEAPELDEYDRRFPALGGQLRLQVSLADAVDRAAPPEMRPAPAEAAVATPALKPVDFDSDFQSFKRLLLEMGQTLSTNALLLLIVRRLAERPHVALARIWLLQPGDICADCPMRAECPDQTVCLHLVASAGRPLHGEKDWSRVDGRFRRMPVGVRMIGQIAARGEPVEVADLRSNATWLADPNWLREEAIRAFAGQPLLYNGRVHGVLGVFFRGPVVGEVLLWLRVLADHAAAAIANAHALEEIERLGGRPETEDASSAEASSEPFHQLRTVAPIPVSPAPGEKRSMGAGTDWPTLPGYEILGELGRGGMGIVYRARQLSLQRTVAVKVIALDLTGESAIVNRFHQEKLLAARLAHPNVVAAYDAGLVAGLSYFVMEFVDGPSLEMLVQQRGVLPVAAACELMRQAALGLTHIHQQGLVHRDIKPSNLLLSPAGLVKVVDLGLARLQASSSQASQNTPHSQILGTLDFMAPEQWDDSHAVDIRADIYSLGCSLYYLLAGQPPYAAPDYATPLQKMKAHAEGPIPAIRGSRTDVPEPLTAVLEHMLAKDRNDRFPTPAEVVAALEPLAAGADLGVLVLPQVSSSNTPMPPTVRPAGPIRVGVLHSLSGTMAQSETPVVEATLLAIEEVNQRGGIGGRRIEAMVRDGQSDELTFARMAERLIVEDQVCALFGCWLSACRKQVVSVLEKHDHLLIYPKTYEGLEQSAQVVYMGATANQVILPAIRWAFAFLGKRRFFLVGLDQVYSRAVSAIAHDEVAALGGQIVGEEYLTLRSTDATDVVGKVVETRPDVILNTVAGDRNIFYTRALRAAGITAEQVPTIHFALGENELRGLAAGHIVGDYAAWSYFQNVDRPENRAFVNRFTARYGPQRVTSDPMEAAYAGVHIWAQAVAAAGTAKTGAVREALRQQSFQAPGGTLHIDPENLHAWKTFRLGKIVEDGVFEVIWSSEKPIRPEPFPASRSAEAWHAFVTELYDRWGGHWANPASAATSDSPHA
jgi:urea transport system substrate-binding protein